MNLPATFLISIFLSGFGAMAYADITPYLTTDKEISFGHVLFISGNCTMSHTDGTFTLSNPDVMCGYASKGVPGRYVIIANPNRQISINILQRNNDGDGFIFIPEGEFISDFETVAITVNVAQQINSGTSGVVNIQVGGRLFINSQTTPNSNFNLIKVDGIEWSELP